MRKLSLVIMAAGLGSRFGGLKQMSPVDDEGHLIIDFSIYDAMRAGFSEVVFIIKAEQEMMFRQAIGDRIAKHIPVRYAYQRLDRLPEGFTLPEGRERPWGTGHAVLCAADQIDGPFGVINADDFYGRSAFETLANYLLAEHAENEHALVSYRIENTLTENGSVSRGVCSVSDGMLTGIVERTCIQPHPDGARYTEDGGLHETLLPTGTPVSMNLWGFQASMLAELEARFPKYLRDNLPINPMKCEYFLPFVPAQLIAEDNACFHALTTDARWYGVTYREDMPRVRAAIASFKAEGIYPEHLWTQ